jgi:dienelactone hydrolase
MRPAPVGREITATTRTTTRIGSALLAIALVCAIAACGSGATGRQTSSGRAATAGARPGAVTRSVPRRPRAVAAPHAPFAVGMRVLTFVDHSRTIKLPGRPPEPRTLVTLIRYPARGPASSVDASGAEPVRGARFPLIIFGHGYAVTPEIYSALLQAWARAGYVVAAPIFPLENANAPGGPDESDLINQPPDMSFIITSLLARSRAATGFLAGEIDPREIAVTGQSDGGETALAVSYDLYYLDHRVRATVILSGAKIPGVGGFDFSIPSPPLLATQGTADTVNPPSFTRAFFDIAPPPKYLLTMFGADHLGPYTDAQPQLRIVARVTLAFLDRYLKGDRGARGRIFSAGDVAGTSAVQSSG